MKLYDDDENEGKFGIEPEPDDPHGDRAMLKMANKMMRREAIGRVVGHVLDDDEFDYSKEHEEVYGSNVLGDDEDGNLYNEDGII